MILRRAAKPDVALTRKAAEGRMALLLPSQDVELWEYAVLVTKSSYPLESVAQLYRDRADAENGFDELKNQWGWGGFTTQDIERCQTSARAVALFAPALGRQASPSGARDRGRSEPEGERSLVKLPFDRRAMFAQDHVVIKRIFLECGGLLDEVYLSHDIVVWFDERPVAAFGGQRTSKSDPPNGVNMPAATAVNQRTHEALEAGEGILRLAPTWVPRSYLVPGRRLKLDTRDLYAYGAHRGGIDERWIASTTPAMNDNRTEDEGLSYVAAGGARFTLQEAMAAEGARLIGKAMWDKYRRWPVYSKFFDNLGPIPHHLHQSEEQARLVGREGKPEGYYFPPQLNATSGNFPHTYFGLEPGATHEDIRRCLERWNSGDNGILDYSKAYRLKPGTGWLVPTRILHAPGSLLTYEPQWGSDVLSMFQSMVDSRQVIRDLLVQDVPAEKHQDLDFLADMVDWPANTDAEFKKHHYIEPIVAAGGEGHGFVDRWVVYGTVEGGQRFSAKELTVEPGARCTLRDPGASGLIVTQGHGKIGKLTVDCPSSIRFGQPTQDELFISWEAATQGITIENHSATDPLVTLRYFGPDVHTDMPEVGEHLLS